MILSGTAFKVSNKENLIGVVIYKNLSFGIQIKSVCRKANQKLKVLARLINYFMNTQKFLLVNSVAKSQFSYALCYGCFVHVLFQFNKSNSLTCFEVNLQWSCQFFRVRRFISWTLLRYLLKILIHQQNLKFLGNKIFKFVIGLSPPIISDLFTLHENPYNLQNFQTLYSSNKKTLEFRIEAKT